MASLIEIDKSTKQYSDSREVVSERVRRLQDIIEHVKRRLLPGIKTAVAQARADRAILVDAIDQSKELFVRPRTLILHGIKIGFAKGKGKIKFSDADKLVNLIQKYYPEQCEDLIKTTKKPIKEALGRLTAADLKKLGITVAGAGDYVVIAPINTDIDKLVSAMLDEEGDDNGSDD